MAAERRAQSHLIAAHLHGEPDVLIESEFLHHAPRVVVINALILPHHHLLAHGHCGPCSTVTSEANRPPPHCLAVQSGGRAYRTRMGTTSTGNAAPPAAPHAAPPHPEPSSITAICACDNPMTVILSSHDYGRQPVHCGGCDQEFLSYAELARRWPDTIPE